MKTLEEQILEADEKSAHWLMIANDLKEKGKTCISCGCGFIPSPSAMTFCKKCIRSCRVKDGRP